jgi:hypothetical protein
MTSAIPADTSSGGMRLNLIPKDGGNIMSGSVFVGGTDGNWQSKNIDEKLESRGIRSANGVAHVQNFNGSLGGPVKKDVLWFFVSARHSSTDETVANVPEHIYLPDGTYIRSILNQYLRDGVLRYAWQVSPKNKFSGWFQRTWKKKGKDFGFGADAGRRFKSSAIRRSTSRWARPGAISSCSKSIPARCRTRPGPAGCRTPFTLNVRAQKTDT